MTGNLPASGTTPLEAPNVSAESPTKELIDAQKSRVVPFTLAAKCHSPMLTVDVSRLDDPTLRLILQVRRDLDRPIATEVTLNHAKSKIDSGC